MKKLLSFFLLMSVTSIHAMQQPKRARRLSFGEEKEVPSSPLKAIPSPSKEGYGTTSDVGTPIKEREVKAQLGINTVNIKNFSGKPALVAFHGPGGQRHRLLSDINSAKKKSDGMITDDMNLVRESLYINAMPELFRIKVSTNKKRLELATLPIRTDASDFRIVGDIEYQPGKVLTIKILKTQNILEPIELELIYE